MARRRRNKRYRRHRLTVPVRFLSLLAICAAIVAAMILFFKVQTVTVTGNDKYTEEQILEVAAIRQGENLFLLNKYEISKEITTALPYVETVTIRRNLPDGIEIAVTESKPMAAFSFENATWLVSSTGKLLEKKTGSTETSLTELVGITPLMPTVASTLELPSDGTISKEVLFSLLRVLTEQGLMEEVQFIDCTEESHLTMRYLNRFDVEILYDADFERMMKALLLIVDSLEDNETGTVILTMKDKMSFKPHALS